MAFGRVDADQTLELLIESQVRIRRLLVDSSKYVLSLDEAATTSFHSPSRILRIAFENLKGK